jgi:DNA-binding NarL/FixJ family response regulator
MAGQRVITIVIADDFGEFRRFIRLKLMGNGFQTVAEATDGLEAVAKVAEFQPDLVLVDISMPKLNGIEAAAQIRSIAPKSVVLFVSQNTDPEIIHAALRDGVAGYVHKSALNRDLLPAIKAALGGNRFVSGDLRLK